MGSFALLMSELTNSLSSAAALVDNLYTCMGVKMSVHALLLVFRRLPAGKCI